MDAGVPSFGPDQGTSGPWVGGVGVGGVGVGVTDLVPRSHVCTRVRVCVYVRVEVPVGTSFSADTDDPEFKGTVVLLFYDTLRVLPFAVSLLSSTST